MSEVDALRAEVESLKAQMRPALEPFDAGVEVTACVLAYNNWHHLPYVLSAYWRQDVRLHLRTAMDRASIDPTIAILTWEGMEHYLVTHKAKSIASYKYLGDIPHKALEEVCAHAKEKFRDACETEWIYFGDGDVVPPDGAIKQLLEEMKADETIGALCIPYQHKVDHQLQGAMLMRTAVAKEIKFSGKGDCVCRNTAERLKKRGLRMTAWASGQMATHLKWRK